MDFLKCSLLILILFGIAVSCGKNFLDSSDGQVISQEEYIKDLTTTQEYLNGVYISLAQSIYAGYHVIYPDLIADNIKPATIPAPALAYHYSWSQQANSNNGNTIQAEDFNANAFSYPAYKTIRSCNFVLEKAEEYKTENVKRAEVMRGEAYALRALVHFWLVNMFAQPYKFTENGSHPGIAYVTSSDYTRPVERKTVGEVYAAIVDDLNNAIRLLPDNSNTYLNLNKNGAKGLLARVYLFKEDFEPAKNLAREVGISVPIMTEGYPEKLFTQQDTETLFWLSPDKNYTLYAAAFFSTDFMESFLATGDIASVLSENASDRRRAWVTEVDGKMYITKFPAGAVSDVYPASAAYYQPIIRSSEMYLTAAEAYAKLKIEDSAKFYLDAIRIRADSQALPTTATGQDLLDVIYKERRKELAFESLRMFDLQRWKKGVHRDDAPDPAAQNLAFPSYKAIAPIPGLDISLSGISQNPGY